MACNNSVLQQLSGKWKGYYEQGGSQHEMLCNLTFGLDGSISGQGIDDIAPYTISGRVEANDSFHFTKQYQDSYAVEYGGTVQWTGSQPTLKGQWHLQGQSDGFMLCPDKLLQQFSGQWKGYYEQGGSQHEMLCNLTFGLDGSISGQGIDDIAPYTISGRVEANDSFHFTKQYQDSYAVEYGGTVQWTGSQPTLKGQWHLQGQSDGFMLCPDKLLQQFSGQWKGYYEQGGSQHEMLCNLTFGLDGSISGQGTDDIAPYTISGRVEANDSFHFTKQYQDSYAVEYGGTVQWTGSQPTLKGQWHLQGQSDGFMLCPDKLLQQFSGQWKGYYEQGGSQHEMLCNLTFGLDGSIIGQGIDDIAPYTISGRVEANDSFHFTKQYQDSYAVEYGGTVQWTGSQPTLKGQWHLQGQSDGFMLTPA